MRTRRRRWLIGTALTTLALGFAPAAQAGAVGATSSSTPPAHVKARISVAAGSIQAVGLGQDVFVLSLNEISSSRQHSVLTEVDATTDAVVGKLDLGLGSVSGNGLPGPLAVGSGSLWVTDFQRNVLDRIDPASLALTAQIPTGVSPTSVVVAFGSVWVSHQHDARLWRIDPLTNRVVARIQVDDPKTYEHGGQYGLTHVAADSTGLLETIGSRDVVVRVSAVANRVVTTYDVAPAFDCGQVLPIAGGFWLDDASCSFDGFHYSFTAGAMVGHFTTNGAGCVLSASVVDGQVYVADSLSAPPPNYDCVDNAVQKLDTTGAVTATRVLPGAMYAWAVQELAGDFWVETGGRHVYRIAAF